MDKDDIIMIAISWTMLILGIIFILKEIIVSLS
nr:MAG TPA: Commissureless [Crassvirales sp.]